MASTVTGKWNGHKFKVSSKLIYGFDGLQIKGSSETEEKEKGDQQYVSRKAGNPTEVSLTVYLNAFTGCSVRSEALSFIKQARLGKKGYFYVGTKKLVSYKLMLTEATVKEVEIAHNHKWTSAQVQLTLKQCGAQGTSSGSSSSSGSSGSKSSSAGSGSGGTYSTSGSSKVSVKTSATTKVPPITVTTAAVATALTVKTAVKTVTTTVKNALSGKSTSSSLATAVKSANSTVKKTVAPAKTATTAKKSASSTKIKALTK